MQGININVTEMKVGQSVVKTVSAREVHKALGNYGSTFTPWISYRLKKHGAVHGVDYTTTSANGHYGTKDFHLTLQTAAKFSKDGNALLTSRVSSYIAALITEATGVAVVVAEPKAAQFSAPAHLSTVKTMSSVEIVEVINALRPAGKAELRHDHFLEKIERHPGINGPNFRGVYLGGNGEQRMCYYLPKREAELMVMSESLEVQTKVYDRLAELELKVVTTTALPSTYLDALKQLVANVEVAERQKAQIEQQAVQIECQKPAVEFVERYVETDGTLGFREMAKLLGAKEQEFRNFLADHKYRHLSAGKWTHYTKWGDGVGNAGYFTLKTGISAKNGLQYSNSYFTPKGIEFITRKWNERKPMLTRTSVLSADIAKLAR